MFYKNIRGNKGFTLIELLVVIAIIGLLSSVVLVSMKGIRTKARDVVRKSDMQALELAVQLYYNDMGTFPANANTKVDEDWPDAYKTQLTPYIKPPIDPLANDATRYYGSSQMTTAPDESCNGQYVVWMYFEGTSDPDYGKYTCGWGGSVYIRPLGAY